MNLTLGSRPTKFQLKGRNLTLVAVGVTALLGLLWYFYLYTPSRASVQTLTTENMALTSDIAIGRTARASLPKLRAEVAQLKAQRDSFLALLPEENEVAELLDQLRDAARVARVGFSGLTNSGPGAEVVTGVRQLNFALATTGNYDRTIAFLRALEALPRFTRIQRVSVGTDTSGEAGATANPSLGASYDFTVYVYTGLEPAAEAGTAPEATTDPASEVQ